MKMLLIVMAVIFYIFLGIFAANLMDKIGFTEPPTDNSTKIAKGLASLFWPIFPIIVIMLFIGKTLNKLSNKLKF